MFNALKLYSPKEFDHYSDNLKNNGCAYCHEIQASKPEDGLPWKIMPLHLNNDWLTKAQFNHAAHRTQQCNACHKVEESVTSADVAIPNRQSCLLCHSGNTQKNKRIASGCMSCHTFHNAHQGYDLITGAKVESKDVDIINALTDTSSKQ